MRELHDLDVSDCPFDERLDTKIARAAENVRQGRVEEAHFDEKNLGRSAADLFSEMLSKRPTDEDLVVTHGDACFPNFMLEGGDFTGFVDCARAGVADRYQDLALACRSIEDDLGPRLGRTVSEALWARLCRQGPSGLLSPSRRVFLNLAGGLNAV